MSETSFQPVLYAGGWRLVKDGWLMDSYIKAHLRENLIQFDAEIGEHHTIQVIYSKYAKDPVDFSLHVHSLQSEASIPSHSWLFEVKEVVELESRGIKEAEFKLEGAVVGIYRLTFQMQYYTHDTNYFMLYNISSC